MSWNHRVVKREDGFRLHEVYYDRRGKPASWTVESVTPFGETVEELGAEIGWMQEALKKPVLEEYSDGNDLRLREWKP